MLTSLLALLDRGLNGLDEYICGHTPDNPAYSVHYYMGMVWRVMEICIAVLIVLTACAFVWNVSKPTDDVKYELYFVPTDKFLTQRFNRTN